MKIGSFVYATEQGLGRLAKSFYDARVLTNVLVVGHGSHPNHLEWYPGAPFTPVRPFDVNKAREFIDGVDVMLFFETPFYWEMLHYCKEKKKKVAFMPMYECVPERMKTTIESYSDVILCPSLLDFKVLCPGYVTDALPFFRSDKYVFTPIPVMVPWKLRTEARTFVHNAGNGSFRDRNGTRLLLDAMSLVKAPIKLILRVQPRGMIGLETHGLDGRIDLRAGTAPYETLWDEGDAFVFPEKWNGLCLPLQEARASGMLVIGADRFPINTWLPREPLIHVDHYQKGRISGAYLEFDEAVIHPEDVAGQIDSWYGTDISQYSAEGKEWAFQNSWEVLRPKYLRLLRELL
jgi:hypothetical protein